MSSLVSRRQKVILHEQQEFSERFGNFLAHLDKSLDSFGANVKSVVYFKFHEDHGLEREDIPRRPDLFIETIERMFGPGSAIVKSHIENEMKELVSPKNGKGQADESAKAILRLISSRFFRALT